MSFLLFFRGLVGVLFVFAIVTYFTTHSLWTTFLDTLICGILIQLGYFVAVLFLVWRTPSAQPSKDGFTAEETARADVADKPIPQIPSASRSRHL